MTVKRIERNCDEFAKVCLTSKDTVYIMKEVDIVYRDTTVEYLIRRDTIHWATPVYIRQGLMNSDISRLEVGLAKSTAQVVSGDLQHFLQSGDTLLRIRLDNALRDAKTLYTKLESRQDIITVKENTKFAGFAIQWFWISFIVIVILVLIVAFKNRLLGMFKRIV